MSKPGEFIGACAANFVVSGSVAIIEGTKAGATSFGIGLLLTIVWLFLFRRKAEATPAALMNNSGNATATGGAGGSASIGDIIVNVPSAAAAAPAPQTIDETRCNIEFLGVEVGNITNRLGHTSKTACAVFENKYTEGQNLRTPTLRGRLIFKRPDGHLILDISNVTWWRAGKTYETFSANTPKQLLLFFDPSGVAEPNLYARTARPRPARFSRFRSDRGPATETHPITEPIGSIEVQLLTENECLFRRVLKFKDGDVEFPRFVE